MIEKPCNLHKCSTRYTLTCFTLFGSTSARSSNPSIVIAPDCFEPCPFSAEPSQGHGLVCIWWQLRDCCLCDYEQRKGTLLPTCR